MALLKPVLLATVPHTGTRFFIHLIEAASGERHHLMRHNTEQRPLACHPFATCHTVPQNEHLLNSYIEKFDPVLITLERDRQAVIASYKKRGKNDGRIDEAYAVQQRFINRYAPLVLSVDSQDRKQRLKKLSAILQLSLNTDWTRVGSWDEKTKMY